MIKDYQILWKKAISATTKFHPHLVDHYSCQDAGSSSHVINICVLAVFVFRPSSWKPVYSHTHLMATPVISSIFIPVASTRETGLQQDDGPLSWQNKSRLFLFDNRQHLLTLEYSSTLEGEKQSPQTKVRRKHYLKILRLRLKLRWHRMQSKMLHIITPYQKKREK